MKTKAFQFLDESLRGLNEFYDQETSCFYLVSKEVCYIEYDQKYKELKVHSALIDELLPILKATNRVNNEVYRKNAYSVLLSYLRNSSIHEGIFAGLDGLTKVKEFETYETVIILEYLRWKFEVEKTLDCFLTAKNSLRGISPSLNNNRF